MLLGPLAHGSEWSSDRCAEIGERVLDLGRTLLGENSAGDEPVLLEAAERLATVPRSVESLRPMGDQRDVLATALSASTDSL